MSNNRRKAWAMALGFSVLATGAMMNPAAQAANRLYRAGAQFTREYRDADSYLQTGQYQAAESKYTAALKSRPGNTQARSSLSLAQAELYKLDAAEKNANQVLSKNPRNGMAHLAKGVVYRNRTASLDMTYRAQRDDMLSKSASELQQAIKYDPRSPEAHNQLGVTYRFMGRNSEAMAEFERALEMDPRFAEARLNQGIMRLSSNDVPGAKDAFNQAIKLNSKNYMAHYRLGEAYLQGGDPHAALQSLNTALSLDRTNASVMSKMADAYQAQGNTAAAVAYYRRSIQANPAFMPAYMSISDIFDNRGDGELAMSELRSALNVNPHFSAGRNRLGRLALTVDKPDQALQYYRESLKENPNDTDAISGISQALTVIAQKQANWSQTVGADSDVVNAEQSIQEALRMNPNDLRLHLANLRISQLAGKPATSDAELNTLASLAPRNDAERMIQGEAFLSLGRYQDADQVFNGLMQQSAGDSDKLLVIGDTLKVNGDLTRARDAYKMALTADPSSLKAQRGLDRIDKAQAESQKTFRLAKALNNWRQKGSSVDFYEETLSQNPRQPDARLELSKLYEKGKLYDKAARSYQFYLGLRPDMPEKERQSYLKKIMKLQELAQKADLQQQRNASQIVPRSSALGGGSPLVQSPSAAAGRLPALKTEPMAQK
jgi:tetratricopeptide (TPR) repeat protein